MKYTAACPRCGSIHLAQMEVAHSPEPRYLCRTCNYYCTEFDMLRHMREKPGMDRNAPAFKVLDLKPKARSAAARAVFG